MTLLATLAAMALGQGATTTPRFELASPLPTIPGVMMDAYANGVGLAIQTARAKGLQARILWIDATANIERYNTEAKIVALVRQIRDAGFNTIVFDVKPISGQVVYKSALAPKLLEWKGQRLPADFDPLPIMVREAKANRLGIYASLNAFSEGHALFRVGPGYARPESQTVLYETKNVLRGRFGSFPLGSRLGRVEPDVVSVLTSAGEAPPEQPGAFAVTLRSTGSVVDGFAFGGIGRGVPTVPKGGVLLYATGAAAEFLRRSAVPGESLRFDTEPVYVPISERPEQQYPLMMNPNDPDVRRYALDVIREVVSGYAVDGILYDDRLRYGGMNADFSELTRRQFEAYIGRPLLWPNDVFQFTITQRLERGIRPGRYFDAWMAWRAAQLKGFLASVRTLVKEVRPSAQLGLYAGSWYGEYPAIGNNYGAPDIRAGFWFLTPEYARTGMAPLLDFLITGAYYKTATIYEALGRGEPIGATVEFAGILSNRVVRHQTWVYAGISLSDFRDDPDGLMRALQAATASTQGVMVFDLSHNIAPMWAVFARAFAQPRRAPNTVPGLLDEVRRKRRSVDATGAKEPPIIIATGSAGVGQ